MYFGSLSGLNRLSNQSPVGTEGGLSHLDVAENNIKQFYNI